jgi:large subunit ribosomal protein L23
MKKNIILKPIVTEKMTSLTDKLNRYGFIVATGANKIEIKNEIERAYGVTVESVNTINYMGKASTRFTKTGVQRGRKSDFKKAIVTVADGDVINLYDNI